jgi:hypothetical protein
LTSKSSEGPYTELLGKYLGAEEHVNEYMCVRSARLKQCSSGAGVESRIICKDLGFMTKEFLTFLKREREHDEIPPFTLSHFHIQCNYSKDVGKGHKTCRSKSGSFLERMTC